MSNNNVVESTDNKDLQKIYDAKNTTSLFDFNQLQRALGEASIKLDKSNSFELLRKYDSTQKGKLDLAEFKELYSFVIKLQKLFVKAAGKNDHITINDILLIAKELNLLIKPEAIQLFVKIIFEERSGAIEFQEYLGLILYFHDLQRLYKHYIDYNCLDPNRGGPSSYDWVRHLLLGTKNMSKIYETIKQLQKIQQTEVLPPFDEFVQVFVENLGEKVIAEYFTRKFDTVHNDEARIKLKKSPKRNITAPAPVDPAVPSSGDSASGSGNINIAPSGLFEDPDFAVGPQLLPDKDKNDVKYWKRPQEINPNAQLFVDGVNAGDVIQVYTSTKSANRLLGLVHK